MKILGVNYNFQSDKAEKSSLSCKALSNGNVSFQGALSRFAQKSPTISADLLEIKNGLCPRDKGFVGVFPPEFIKAIKRNLGTDCCPQRIKECVEGAKKTLIEAARILEKVEEQTLNNRNKNVRRMNLNNFLKELKENLKWKVLEDDSAEQIELQNKLIKRFTPNKVFIRKTEIEVSKILERGLKENKILPLDAKVIVKRLDEGNTGTAYKMSFIDENQQNIFVDKVIKYYKNIDAIFNSKFNLALIKLNIMKGNIDEISSKITEICNFFPEEKFPKIKNIKKMILEEIELCKTKSSEEYKEIVLQRIQKQRETYKSCNGMHKEAVLASYIRNAIGHRLENSDLVNLYYVDLNNKYSILDFSSLRNLGPITKKNCYEALGFNFTDIIEDIHNFVDGRLIDYGGYEITNKLLAENPVARRFYKKIKHIEGKDFVQKRVDRINELYAKASNNELPQSSDVILGLKEAGKLIPESRQNLLSFNI